MCQCGRKNEVPLRFGCCWPLLPVSGTSLGQDAAEFFRQNCTTCHTIGGGRLTGPDLKGVLQRKPRAWLLDFIMDPQAVLDRGVYAGQMVPEDCWSPLLHIRRQQSGSAGSSKQ
jgi:mono/diheme cytochrome c family protein